MARWRRRSPGRRERLTAAGVSLALGAGVATVTYYVARLLLSREELAGSRLPSSETAGVLPERASGDTPAGLDDNDALPATKGRPDG
jgi:hypothetical protein